MYHDSLYAYIFGAIQDHECWRARFFLVVVYLLALPATRRCDQVWERWVSEIVVMVA